MDVDDDRDIDNVDDSNDDGMDVDYQEEEEEEEEDDDDDEEEEEDENADSMRRSSRRIKPTKSYREVNDSDDDDDIDDDEEVDDYDSRRQRDEPSRNATARLAEPDEVTTELVSFGYDIGKRRSGRSNKFSSSMKEAPDSIYDLFESSKPQKSSRSSATATNGKKAASSHAKKRDRHSSNRKSVLEEHYSDYDDDDYARDDDMDVDHVYHPAPPVQDETMKIQRIMACRTLPLKKWREIGSKMNTSEVTNGSRWNENSEPATDEDSDKLEERYLVKWNGLSYIHVTWETQKDLEHEIENSKTAFRMFFKKQVNGLVFSQDDRKDGDYFDPDWVQIDRILGISISYHPKYSKKRLPRTWKEEEAIDPIEEFGVCLDNSDPVRYDEGKGRKFYIKWASQNYSESTYEFEQDLIEKEEFREKLKEYYERTQKPSRSETNALEKQAEAAARQAYIAFGDKSNLSDEERKDRAKRYEERLCEHVFRNGGQLRDYQAHGVTWFLSNYVNKRSCILADEMGLGKTIQTASFVNILVEKMHTSGPFLVCAPLSTIAHWQREFEGWTNLNTIVYYGSASDREIIRQYEFAYEEDRPEYVGFNALYLKKCKGFKSNGPWMATVVITTPEMLVAEGWSELAAVQWNVLVVDEAHRLKNHTSKLAVNLRRNEFSFKHKILLTGTPIQNDVKEFWALLTFIDPVSFPDLDTFLEKFGDIKEKETLDELHDLIRPYILRRLKEDVEKSVPPKEETLIEVELTVLQKQYYKALYEKNVAFLHKNKKKALDGPSLNNLAMQLRKCCNHLFLLNGVEQEIRSKQEVDHYDRQKLADFMMQGSGKFVLLDKLLPRLKEGGHRILIFSQFKIMLDVLQDYLYCRDYRFERIDGSITGQKRQAAIDRFQDSQSKTPPFVMLLSTRAGGVGINLTAADTCIIFDSDWNPQNDVQAMARCHRIGQTKSVKIYRLLSRKTYEMQMFHLSSMKMGLNQTVLSGFEISKTEDGATLTKEEVERLLRHGAYDIFSEDKSGTGEAESKDFIEADIDSILARRTRHIVHENTGSGSSAKGGTFSKASFINLSSKSPSKDKASKALESIDINDPDFWTKMIGDAKPEEESIIYEKRRRKETNYNEDKLHKSLHQAFKSGDVDSISDSSDDDSDDSVDDPDETERTRWGGNKPSDWKQIHAEQLYDQIERCGYGIKPWEDIKATLPKDCQRYSLAEIKRMAWSMVLSTLCEVSIADGKASARRIKARRENDGDDLVARISIADTQTEEAMIGNAFNKHLKQNSFWIKKAFDDAVAYGRENQPRIFPTDHSQTIFSMFNNDVWPALQLRGWQANEDNAGAFIYQAERYDSPSEAMIAAIRLHPDISELIQAVLKKLEEARLESDKINRRQLEKDLSLSVSTADINTVEDFLKKYGSMQLLTQRTRTRSNPKMLMGKRLITSCQYVSVASELVKTADAYMLENHDYSCEEDALTCQIAVDERVNLPCSGWMPKHDAILVRAIAKHGWLEIDRSLSFIVNDKSISWGAPFEKAEDAPTEGKPKSSSGIDAAELHKVAERTAKVLNEYEAVFGASKAFSKDLLVETYGLVRSTVESDHPDQGTRWKVSDLLQPMKSAENINDIEEVSDAATDLPAKKLLVTRAKKVMSRPLDVLSGRGVLKFVPKLSNAAESVDVQKKRDNHGYAIIDQGNDCNLLLVQLLRFIINTHPGSHAAAHRIAFDLAEKEIAMNSRSSRVNQLAWKMISDQVSTARREITKTSVVSRGKNVLRVMIGEQPKALGAGPLFPPETDEKENIQNGVALRGGKRVVKKSSGEKSEGEKAIARSIRKATDTNNGNNTFANAGDKSSLGLQLTLGEVTLLCVLCSLGIPLSSMKTGKDNAVAKKNKTWREIYRAWAIVVNEQLTVAEKLVNQFKTVLVKAQAGTTSPNDLRSVAENMAKAEKTLKDREDANNVVKGFEDDVVGLAKKSMMLVETVRRHGFGPSAAMNGSATHKFENFLGPKIPVWFKNELEKSFINEGLQQNGKPLTIITADVAMANPDYQNSSIGAFLDKKGARQITSQIALMTRLQYILLANSEESLRSKISTAISNSARLKEAWDNKPKWWDDSSEDHTLLLLTRLNEHGFSKLMTTTRATTGFGDPNSEDQIDVGSLKDIGLSKPIIQQRANQLVRELHQLEESEKVLRRFDRRSLDSLASLPSNASSSSASKKSSVEKKKATKQTDMMSFFQRKSYEKKIKPSAVLSVETSDNDIRRDWRRSSGSSSSPDSLASVGKRKDRAETSPEGGNKSMNVEDKDVIVLDDSVVVDDENSAPSPSEKKKAKN